MTPDDHTTDTHALPDDHEDGPDNGERPRQTDPDIPSSGGHTTTDAGDRSLQDSLETLDDTVSVDPATSELDASIDEMFELLARPGNRFVLTYVARATEPVTYGELIEYVVECSDPPRNQSVAEFRGRVATRLVHSNLPKLESLGVIETTERGDETVVTATDGLAAVVPFLELAIQQDTDHAETD